MSENSIIQVDNLRKIYHDPKRGEVRAVDGISFSVEKGTVYGLLGPNGAGKTTTLRMIGTLLRPTSGHALVCGHDTVKAGHQVRQSIGFLSADTKVYDRMTPRETVRFFGRLNGMTDETIATRTETLFEAFEIGHYADTLNFKLSTGMRQKVSLARTVVHDPPVLIFDEPTTGLDILISRVVIDFIQSIRGEGRVILFSTHIMSEAEQLCDRVAFIYEGQILREGPKDEVVAAESADDLGDAFFRAVDHAKTEPEVPA